MKTCTKCKENKALEDYYNRKKASDGKNSHCKECENKEIYLWRIANKEKQAKIMWRANLKRNYGMSEDDYYALLLKQKERCVICERHKDEFEYGLCVDHDHETGRVRGLLCRSCNHRVISNHDLAFFERCVKYMNNDTVSG